MPWHTAETGTIRTFSWSIHATLFSMKELNTGDPLSAVLEFSDRLTAERNRRELPTPLHRSLHLTLGGRDMWTTMTRVKDEEKRLGTEINYTVMSEEEFLFRKKRSDPFILSILTGSRLMLVGDEEQMLA